MVGHDVVTQSVMRRAGQCRMGCGVRRAERSTIHTGEERASLTRYAPQRYLLNRIPGDFSCSRVKSPLSFLFFFWEGDL